MWTWYRLLQKRFLKKYSFLIILLLIPLLVRGMENIANQKSGMLSVALCKEDENDKMADAVIKEFLQEDGLLQYTQMDSVEEAKKAVEVGSVDAAWIIEADLNGRLEAFAKGELKGRPIVTIIQREENIALQLANEKFFAKVFPGLSNIIYSDFIRSIPGLEEIDDETIRKAYEKNQVKESLFQFGYADTNMNTQGKDIHYLLMPMRGLLCLVIMLCALAAALYLTNDIKESKFVWIKPKYKQAFYLFYYLPVVLISGIAVMLAQMWSGLFTELARECIAMLLYMVMTIGFVEIVRQITGKIQILGAAIPLMILLMLVICPVFVEFKNFRLVQYMLPPYYYLTGIYNTAVLVKALIYIGIVYGFLFIKEKFKK